jgi:hypothetical protein
MWSFHAVQVFELAELTVNADQLWQRTADSTSTNFHFFAKILPPDCRTGRMRPMKAARLAGFMPG